MREPPISPLPSPNPSPSHRIAPSSTLQRGPIVSRLNLFQPLSVSPSNRSCHPSAACSGVSELGISDDSYSLSPAVDSFCELQDRTAIEIMAANAKR